tara:strand:+ start:130228 stop:130860 length:633 start_codon:yes stop_codon:yes gene_type:complete
MFTGLVKELGRVKSIQTTSEGKRFEVECPKLISEIQIDDSISINGVCQTAVKVSEKSFVCDAVKETLKKTTLSEVKINDIVNLELALRLGDRLGGHLVQGHVNDTAVINSISNIGNNWIIWITFNKEISKYIVSEGSITVDGISLTVAQKEVNMFKISVIPHTYENTILKNKKVGSKVNLEIDVLAKYVENMMKNNNKSIDLDWLQSEGF